MKLNNVDMAPVAAFAEDVKNDKSKALRAKKIEGSWNFDEAKPQFSATITHASGSTLVEADAPLFLGGLGLKPDPVQYCLFGLAACFAQTFASVAAEKGVKLSKLSVSAENRLNLSASLGIGDEPPVESVKLTVSAAADGADLAEIQKLALERCPGVYCLTKPIKLETELKSD